MVEVPKVTVELGSAKKTFFAQPKHFKKSGRDGFFSQISITIDGVKFRGQFMIWGPKVE